MCLILVPKWLDILQNLHYKPRAAILHFALTFKQQFKFHYHINQTKKSIISTLKMFKKTIKIGAQNQLSGKDRKNIKTKMSQVFDSHSIQTLFAKNQKIISAKVSSSKMLIFSGDEYPLLVDGTGKNDYFPTLYTMIAYEPIIKYLHINEGVEHYIFNGANLMWPGVKDLSQLGNFKQDEVIGIKNSRGQPIAIGAAGCSFEDYQKSNDNSGIAAYILHYKGDKLWEIGSKSIPQVIVQYKQVKKREQNKEEVVIEKQQNMVKQPVVQKQVIQQPKKILKKQESQSSSDSANDDANFMGLLDHVNKNKAPGPKVQTKKKSVTFVFDDEDDGWDKRGKKKGGKKKKAEEQAKIEKSKKQHKKKQSDSEGQKQKSSESQKEEQKKETSVISTKIMDNLLRECFLNVLKLSKVQGQLPIDSGKFYMDYMLLARPQGVVLDIKQSSYKKLGKFYDQMSKQKFIEFKHTKDKKGLQGPTITKILYENQDLKNFVPTIKKMNNKDADIKDEDSSKVKIKLNKSIYVQNVYKPNELIFNAIFKKKINFLEIIDSDEPVKKQQPQFYTEEEMKAKINKYLQQICENKADNKTKQKKSEKKVLIDYKKHKFIQQLMSKQIHEYQENLEKQQQPSQDSDENQEKQAKKKLPKKHGVFRVDRQYIVSKIIKKSEASFNLIDKQNQVNLFKEGTFKGIQLTAEKANNKNITKIIGLETFIVPLEQADKQINAICQMFQQKFACSVNILNLPGKNTGKQLILHGTFLDQLEDFFVQQHGINKRFLTFVNKLDKKKKNH